MRLNKLEQLSLTWERKAVAFLGLPVQSPGTYIALAMLTLMLWIVTLAFDQAWLSGNITGDPTLTRWDARYGLDDLSLTLADHFWLGLAFLFLNGMSAYVFYAWVGMLIRAWMSKRKDSPD